jgi:hypothetical protein
MLETAGFYSVEEDFSLEFGKDPKVTIHSDFKIEKTSESLFNRDTVLLNTGRQPLSPYLKGFLKNEGFTVFETSARSRPAISRPPYGIKQITTKRQTEMVDAILDVLAISPGRDRHLDVFATDDNGISLSVKADRTFSRNGKNFVVSRFDGDPVTYTLFRILETKGYRVVILDRQDDFRKTAERVLSAMKIRAAYGQHELIQEEHTPVSLQMSGFWLDDTSLPGGSLFLTNLELDRNIRSLLAENGYNLYTSTD